MNRVPRRGRKRSTVKRLAGSAGPAKTNIEIAALHRSGASALDGCNGQPKPASRPKHGKRWRAEEGRNTLPNKKLVAPNQIPAQSTLSAASVQPPALVLPSATVRTEPKHAMLAFLLRRKAKNVLTPAQAAALQNLQEDLDKPAVSPPSPCKKARLG